MNWERGYFAKYILATVDPGSWGDTGEIPIIDGVIDRDASTELLESASLSVTERVTEQLVRVYMICKQHGETVREALFTGLSTTPSRNINGNIEKNTLECYSVLKYADDVLLPLGYFAAAGSIGSQIIRRLLSDLPCEVMVEAGSPLITNNIVAGASDSKLKMARLIADAINWEIRTDGMGNVTVGPKPSEPVVYFDANAMDIIEPKLTEDHDLFSIPNVVRVTRSDSTAIARNDDPENVYSTVGRGREIWKSETAAALSSDESLASYAMRRLKELQAPARTLNYTRRFHPDVVPNSLVGITYPKQDLTGIFRISSQSITLGHAARTEEEAVSEA